MEVLDLAREFLVSNPLSGNPWQILVKLVSWTFISAFLYWVADKFLNGVLEKNGGVYKVAVSKAKLGVTMFAGLFFKYVINPFIAFVERIDDEGIDKIKEKLPKSGEKIQDDVISLVDEIVVMFEGTVKKLKKLKKDISD